MSQYQIHLRPAVDSDLDALVWIATAAFPFEPQWPYRYPFAAKYPKDHLRFTKNRYREWLEAARTPECSIIVAETPATEDYTVRKVVGLSIWRLPYQATNEASKEKMKPPKANLHRRDANPSHVDAYRNSVGEAQKQCFDRMLGRNQLSLAQLATHPDYFRRGAATKMLEWGVALSERAGRPITVFAGPMAYKLYKSFGFKVVVKVTTQVRGEHDKIQFPGMTREPDGQRSEKAASQAGVQHICVVHDPQHITDTKSLLPVEV